MKQVYFHIGAPKTGTTFLQQVMWHNRQRMAALGACYPLDHPTGFFAATLDLCQRKWGGRWDPTWDGAWDRVADRIRDWDGDRAIYSAEIMGLVTPEQAARAVESVQPAEVHVVFTARDLARQFPSDWQEQVKHRHTVTLTKFVDDLVRLGRQAPRPFGELFWGLHDPIHVLSKWEDAVPPERIHVVTVPPSTAPPDTLWRRFATVCGLDPDAYDLDVPRDNTAMGVVETEYLRRFNATSGKGLTYEHGPIITNLVGQRLLANRPGKQSIRMPREFADWVDDRSEQLIEQLQVTGYDVVGDLAELLPVRPPADESEILPEDLTVDDVDAVGYDLVAGLVHEVLTLRGQVRNLTAQLRPNGPIAKAAAAKKAAEKRVAEQLAAGLPVSGPAGRGGGQGGPQKTASQRASEQQAGTARPGEPAKGAAKKAGAGRQGANKQGAAKQGANKQGANKQGANKQGANKQGADKQGPGRPGGPARKTAAARTQPGMQRLADDDRDAG